MLLVLLTALELQESGGNKEAFNPVTGATGILQITQPCLTDVNQRYGKAFVLGDMQNRTVARWIALRYLEMYRCQTYEECAKTFYAGPGWRKKQGKAKERVDRYWYSVNRIIYQLEMESKKK